MKFEITANNLTTAFRILSSALGTEKTITSYILFRNTGDLVECVTFNGPSHCMTPIDSENLSGPKGESFCLEGRRLDMFLKAAASDKRNVEVSYDSESKVITLRDSRGAHKFPSEDPRNFSTFDESLAQATPIAQVRADSILSALKFVRPFIGVKDSDKGLHTTEFRGGRFMATDRASLALATVPNLPEDASIRVYGNTLKNLESFLSVWKDQSVEVLTTESAVYYRSLDGAVFGEERYPDPFKNIPEQALATAKDYVWVISKEELVNSLNWLWSGSELGSYKVRLSSSPDGLVLATRSVTKELITCTVPLISQEGDLENETLSTGFWISNPVLSRVFGVCDDTITINAQLRTVKGQVSVAIWIQSVSDVTGNVFTAYIAQERE